MCYICINNALCKTLINSLNQTKFSYEKKYLSLAAFIILLSTSVNLNAANPTSVSTDITSISAIDAFAPSSNDIDIESLTYDAALAEIRLVGKDKLDEDIFYYGLDANFVTDLEADSLDCYEMANQLIDDFSLFNVKSETLEKHFKEDTLDQLVRYVQKLLLER